MRKSPAKRSTSNRARKRDTSVAQLAEALANMRPTAVMGEPKVGIRNISNYTIGLVSPYQDEPEVQLSGPRYERDNPTCEVVDPSMGAVISHKWWLALRRGDQMRKGMIIRDDSLLSADTVRAPADEERDLPAGWYDNAVIDPHEWIASKDESQLKDALARITAEETMRRLLTAVNQRIEQERIEAHKRTDLTEQKQEELALRNLPWRYKIVEEVLLERLEDEFYSPDKD